MTALNTVQAAYVATVRKRLTADRVRERRALSAQFGLLRRGIAAHATAIDAEAVAWRQILASADRMRALLTAGYGTTPCDRPRVVNPRVRQSELQKKMATRGVAKCPMTGSGRLIRSLP
jgi:hypothetical protein